MSFLRKTLLATLLASNTVISYAQEGRWQSLDESTPSSPSGFGAIILTVVGLIIGGFLIKLISSDDQHQDGKGCAITFIILIILAGIIAAISLVN